MFATSNVTVIRGNGSEFNGIASGTIRPGHLVEPTGTGRQFQVQNMVGAVVAPLFAREQFENNGAGIEDTIASGDDMAIYAAQKGDIINCICTTTITRGTLVGSNGSGGVQSADSEHAIGIAWEATYDHGALLRVPVMIF